MLDTFLFSINAVAPLALLMALGVFLRWRGIFKEDFFNAANKLSFNILLPVMFFCNIYDAELLEHFDWRYVGIGTGILFGLFVLLLIVTPFFVKDKTRIGVIVQGIYRSNFLVFGIPVVVNMFGEGELWTTSMLMPFIVPMFNITAVFALTWHLSDRHGAGRVKDTLLSIVKNPLIIAAVISYAFLLLRIRLPGALYKTAKDIANMGSPLALIALGGTLTFSSMRRNRRALTTVAVGKLVAVPAIMLSVALALGYRGSTIGALVALSGSPTAISSYVMAQQSGNDGDLAGQVVVTTTIASVATIFTWVFALRSFGFL